MLEKCNAYPFPKIQLSRSLRTHFLDTNGLEKDEHYVYQIIEIGHKAFHQRKFAGIEKKSDTVTHPYFSPYYK